MSANDQEGVRGDGRTSYEEAGRGSRKSYGESGRGGRKSYEEAGRGGRKEYDSEGRGSRNGGWRQKRKKADLTKEVNKDDMKVRESVLAVTTVITEVKKSSNIVGGILDAGQRVGLDTEGVNLGPTGQITLVQISTSDGQVYIFDVLTTPTLFKEGRLADLLQAEHIQKVIHDCTNDSGALKYQHGIILRNIFDTQSVHRVLQMQTRNIPVYLTQLISFNNLCKEYKAPINNAKDEMKKIYIRDNKFWARRPLSDEMIYYAASDVLPLVPALHQSLNSELREEYSSLFLELVEEQIYSHFLQLNPNLADRKKKREQPRVEIRVLLSSKMVGYSGKCCIRTKDLQERFTCLVSLPTCGGGDRVLGLKGEDQEPMLECLEAALLNIEEEKSQPRDIRLLIPNYIIEREFGASKEKVQDLLQGTDVKIEISAECAPLSTERVVQVVGLLEDVMAAAKLIYDKVQTCSLKSKQSKYSAKNYDASRCAEYLGWVQDKEDEGRGERRGGDGRGRRGGGRGQRRGGSGRGERGLFRGNRDSYRGGAGGGGGGSGRGYRGPDTGSRHENGNGGSYDQEKSNDATEINEVFETQTSVKQHEQVEKQSNDDTEINEVIETQNSGKQVEKQSNDDTKINDVIETQNSVKQHEQVEKQSFHSDEKPLKHSDKKQDCQKISNLKVLDNFPVIKTETIEDLEKIEQFPEEKSINDSMMSWVDVDSETENPMIQCDHVEINPSRKSVAWKWTKRRSYAVGRGVKRRFDEVDWRGVRGGVWKGTRRTVGFTLSAARLALVGGWKLTKGSFKLIKFLFSESNKENARTSQRNGGSRSRNNKRRTNLSRNKNGRELNGIKKKKSTNRNVKNPGMMEGEKGNGRKDTDKRLNQNIGNGESKRNGRKEGSRAGPGLGGKPPGKKVPVGEGSRDGPGPCGKPPGKKVPVGEGSRAGLVPAGKPPGQKVPVGEGPSVMNQVEKTSLKPKYDSSILQSNGFQFNFSESPPFFTSELHFNSAQCYMRSI